MMDVNQLDPAWPITSQQPFSWIQTNSNMINRSMSKPVHPVPSTKKRKRSKEDSEDSDDYQADNLNPAVYHNKKVRKCSSSEIMQFGLNIGQDPPSALRRPNRKFNNFNRRSSKHHRSPLHRHNPPGVAGLQLLVAEGTCRPLSHPIPSGMQPSPGLPPPGLLGPPGPLSQPVGMPLPWWFPDTSKPPPPLPWCFPDTSKPPPPPAAAPIHIDLNNLFDRLTKTGLIEKRPTEEEQIKEDNKISIEDWFNSKNLRKRRSYSIDGLYDGMQQQESTKKSNERRFYLSVKDWLQYKEIEDVDERAPRKFELEGLEDNLDTGDSEIPK